MRLFRFTQSAFAVAVLMSSTLAAQPAQAEGSTFTWTDPSGDTRNYVGGKQENHPPADILAAQVHLTQSGDAYVSMELADWFPSTFVATWALTADPSSDGPIFKFEVRNSGSSVFASASETRYGTYRSLDCGEVAGVSEPDDVVILVFDPACLPDVPLYVRASTYDYNGSQYDDWAPDANFESSGFGSSQFSSYNWTGPVTKTAPTPAPRPEPVARSYTEVCADAPAADFSDIDGNVHAPAIRCVAGYGIAQGTGSGRYSPSRSLTKGQTATFLMRTLDVAGYDVPRGDDVCRGSGGVHEDSLEALMGVGVVPVGDCAAGTRITRAVMAAWSLAVIDGAGVPPSENDEADFYPDDDGHRYEPSINGLTGHGVVTGKPDGTFGPDQSLSRAQMATFLARILDVIAY